MVIDENLAFASMGIGDKVQYFPFVKVYNSNSAASALTDYFFEFKSGVYFPSESYLLIYLDPGSGFPFTSAGPITCSAI